MPTERTFQRPRTRRRNPPLVAEVFDRNTRPFQLTRQPAFAVGRHEDDTLSPAGLQRRRKLYHHALSPSWAVRSDQMCDPKPRQIASGTQHHDLRRP